MSHPYNCKEAQTQLGHGVQPESQKDHSEITINEELELKCVAQGGQDECYQATDDGECEIP